MHEPPPLKLDWFDDINNMIVFNGNLLLLLNFKYFTTYWKQWNRAVVSWHLFITFIMNQTHSSFSQFIRELTFFNARLKIISRGFGKDWQQVSSKHADTWDIMTLTLIKIIFGILLLLNNIDEITDFT